MNTSGIKIKEIGKKMINFFTNKNNISLNQETFRQKAIRFGKIYLKIAIAMYILMLGYSLIAKYTELDTKIFNSAFPENEKDVEVIRKYLMEYINQTKQQEINDVTFIKNLSATRKNQDERSGKILYSFTVDNVRSEVIVKWKYDGEYKIINVK